jgi:RES domain-containing protein
MPGFQTIFDYNSFAERVTDRTRYRYSHEDEDFLATVKETGFSRIIALPAGTSLFRAQLDHRMKHFEVSVNEGEECPYPCSPDRMIPLPKSAMEGRVNPKGIPCLYLADRAHAAMSEVRPWLGALVSLGHFRTKRDLKLMDCTASRTTMTLAQMMGTASPPELERKAWEDISYAFSEPVTASNMKAEYAPTQVLAEVFKEMGCDGIKYRSLLSDDGCSFALFKIDDAKLIGCGLCETTSIEHVFAEEHEAYGVTDDGVEVQRGLGLDD